MFIRLGKRFITFIHTDFIFTSYFGFLFTSFFRLLLCFCHLLCLIHIEIWLILFLYIQILDSFFIIHLKYFTFQITLMTQLLYFEQSLLNKHDILHCASSMFHYVIRDFLIRVILMLIF